MSRRPLYALLFGSVFFAPVPLSAQDMERDKEVGIGAAYTHSFRFTPAEHSNRESILIAPWWSTPLGHRLRWVIEPNVGTFYRPVAGTTLGLNTSLRWYPWARGRALPFIGAGGGVLYTWFPQLVYPVDFTVYPEAGLSIPMTHRLSFLMDYRMYHISNGHLRKPNVGINSNFAMLGVSWLY